MLQGTQRRVERISQAVVSIRSSRVESPFEPVRAILLAWLREKAGRELTDLMLQGRSDSLDLLGAQRVETVALDESSLWAARQDFLDETVPRRTWVTEAMLATANTRNLLLGFRLHCVTLGEPAPFSRTIPRFMREVARNHCVALDGVETDLHAQEVDTPAEAEELHRLLIDPARKSPVVAVSMIATGEEEQQLLNADRLASAVFGVGHVRLISRAGSFALTDLIGKRFSAFNGAVRIWWPNLRLGGDDPYDHPLWLADRVFADGSDATLRSIVDRVLRNSAGRRDADEAIPSFAEARRAAATLLRETVAADESRAAADILPLYEAENTRLVDEMKDLRAEQTELINMVEDDLRTMTKDRDEARSEIYALRARLTEIEKAIRFREQAPDIEIPDNFEDLEAWAQLYVAGTVILLPRAIKAARKSVLEEPALAYRALLLLHEAYVPMRRSGSLALRTRWDGGLKQLGLECSPTHSSTRAGENASDYFVNYEGRNVEIDMHLKGSSSRDPRYCFRLYFFWDERNTRAVVAWLPSHLETRIT